VRPERISILTDGAASEGPNRLSATVQNTIYLGDHALAVLEVAATRVHGQASAGRAWKLSHGQSVSITFRPKTA